MKYIHYIHFYNGGTTTPHFTFFRSNDVVPTNSQMVESMEECINHGGEKFERHAVVSISTVLNK